jgi:hypothetical protein
MKKSTGDIYIDEISAAVLRAGGGIDGCIDVTAAVMGCASVAVTLAGMMPEKDGAALAKHVAGSFQRLVAETHEGMKSALSDLEPVKLQ